MEEKGQHEVTSDITVNHYDEEYKFYAEIYVIVQVFCFLEKEKRGIEEEVYAGQKQYSIESAFNRNHILVIKIDYTLI